MREKERDRWTERNGSRKEMDRRGIIREEPAVL
jgi:hypothetical protein